MCLSCTRTDGLSSPLSKSDGEDTALFRPLELFFHRSNRYWPQLPSGRRKRLKEGLEPVQAPASVLISWDIVFRGGFPDGMRLTDDARLLIRFIDEWGQMFEGDYSFHRPWRVADFMSQGFLRLRLFSDFLWRPLSTVSTKGSSDCARGEIAFTDSSGERHHFAFPVTSVIRGIFPVAPTDVT